LARFVLQVPGFNEGAEASVESFFDIVWEAAAGQFFDSQMTPYTFAAYSLFAARICAIAVL
jgi:hypothetical protein